MSKNITIQEGGIAKQLTVDKLKTNLVGGGTCLWVPEDETVLGTKNITENGTYKAVDDGYYGYSEVTVSGIGAVTGKDPDGSGDDAQATVDPETGVIVINKLPSSIRVIRPPTNPYGIYMDGQAIAKDGMVVKAYDVNGDEMQIVPNGEITLNPSTAVYDPATDVQYYVSGGIHAVGVLASNIYQNKRGGVDYYGKYSLAGVGAYYIGTIERTTVPDDTTYYLTKYDESVYIATNKNNGVNRYENRETGITPAGNVSGNYGKTFNTNAFFTEWFANVPTSTENPLNKSIDDLEPEGDQAGSHQTITVSWPRPGDGAILETTFDILARR